MRRRDGQQPPDADRGDASGGGGAIGYIVGTETENNRYYGGYGPYRGYYPGGY